MSKQCITLAGRRIGPGEPPYIVAEMSGNHNGDLNRAIAIMEAAAAAGADAVKLQTYTADTITLNHDGENFKISQGLWAGRTLYDLYEEAHTPWDWHETLFQKGRELGITVFSSPFDPTAIDFLESLDTPAYKIASFEIVDIPLIRLAAKTGKPLIISTGMSSLGEIGEAIGAARSAGAHDLALLHCTSGYPTPPEEANLATIPHLAQAFGIVVGLSDHIPGIAAPVASISLGAAIIEKHFTLCRDDGGPDAAFSLEPAELKNLVDCCRTAWKATGTVSYERTESEKGNVLFRRSLYVVADIHEGEEFTPENVRSIRPGDGLAPKHLDAVLGRCASRDLKRGAALDWGMIA
ncbi:MAG: pseudaminic acid synthase [Gammaproteobacteria bacterium]|nr:pseudaminic acid synthase [Gammaproteobacteria bacterium]